MNTANEGREVGYTPRRFESGRVYEVCMRVVEGLPFACNGLINQILKSAMARSQRDQKVIICHYLWMSNHLHMMVVCRDQQGLAQFQCELKKKITDSIKRLFGKEHLFLWERRSSVAVLAEAHDVLDRLVYFYLNPQRANLVDSIEDYPGLSTWYALESAKPDLNSVIREEVPWIKTPAIPKMPKKVDCFWFSRMAKALQKKCKEKEILEVSPHAWMRCFYENPNEYIEEYVGYVKKEVRQKENLLREERVRKNKSVRGSLKLKSDRPSIKGWKPKKKERRIFLICQDSDQRKKMLASFRNFVRLCRECYQLYLRGYRDVEWPPGSFSPSLPRLYNCVRSYG